MHVKMLKTQKTGIGRLLRGVVYTFDSENPMHVATADNLVKRKMAEKMSPSQAKKYLSKQESLLATQGGEKASADLRDPKAAAGGGDEESGQGGGGQGGQGGSGETGTSTNTGGGGGS